MKLNEVKTVLPILMKHDIVPFLHGSQGLGKTETVKQVAKALGIDFVALYPATQEVGDLVGLLMKREDGSAYHSRPEWFPTEGSGILFLDELNRAHPDVIQAMFSLITNKTIHTHKLPEGWHIVAAGNYNTASFNVTDTSDAAWMSRFCHIDFTPTHEEFLEYIEDKGGDTIAAFVRSQPDMLEVKSSDKNLFESITPDRRSFDKMILPLETEDAVESVRFELYKGIIGTTAAAAFQSFKVKNERTLSGRMVLNNYPKHRSKILELSTGSEVRFDSLNSTVEEVLTYFEQKKLKPEQLENFKAFLLDLPLEMGLKVINNIGDSSNGQKNEILNNSDFVNKFSQLKLTLGDKIKKVLDKKKKTS